MNGQPGRRGRTLTDLLRVPDDLTCRRLLALLRPDAHPKPASQIGIVSIGGEQVA